MFGYPLPIDNQLFPQLLIQPASLEVCVLDVYGSIAQIWQSFAPSSNILPINSLSSLLLCMKAVKLAVRSAAAATSMLLACNYKETPCILPSKSQYTYRIRTDFKSITAISPLASIALPLLGSSAICLSVFN